MSYVPGTAPLSRLWTARCVNQSSPRSRFRHKFEENAVSSSIQSLESTRRMKTLCEEVSFRPRANAVDCKIMETAKSIVQNCRRIFFNILLQHTMLPSHLNPLPRRATGKPVLYFGSRVNYNFTIVERTVVIFTYLHVVPKNWHDWTNRLDFNRRNIALHCTEQRRRHPNARESRRARR